MVNNKQKQDRRGVQLCLAPWRLGPGEAKPSEVPWLTYAAVNNTSPGPGVCHIPPFVGKLCDIARVGNCNCAATEDAAVAGKGFHGR
jgi:hypothetical protein